MKVFQAVDYKNTFQEIFSTVLNAFYLANKLTYVIYTNHCDFCGIFKFIFTQNHDFTRF